MNGFVDAWIDGEAPGEGTRPAIPDLLRLGLIAFFLKKFFGRTWPDLPGRALKGNDLGLVFWGVIPSQEAPSELWRIEFEPPDVGCYKVYGWATGQPRAHEARPQGRYWHIIFPHNNHHYGRFKIVVSSLREDRKMRVIKWRWLLGILNYQEEKNLQNEGLAGEGVFSGLGQVVVMKRDTTQKNLAVLGLSGDDAHFFWRSIWTNEIRAIMKSDAGLAIEFMVKTLKIEER